MSRASTSTSAAIPTKNIIGEPVINCRGQVLGEIQDLIFSPRTGRILCAIVAFGGFLGVGTKLFAIPWRKLRWKAGEDEISLSVDLLTLDRVPRFDNDDWQRVGDPVWLASLEGAFADRECEEPATNNRTKKTARNEATSRDFAITLVDWRPGRRTLMGPPKRPDHLLRATKISEKTGMHCALHFRAESQTIFLYPERSSSHD